MSTLLLLVLAAPATAIIIRHDRDDSQYRQLATGYPQIVHMNLENPGKPPDGEGTLIGTPWVVTAAHVATLIEPVGAELEISAGNQKEEAERT